MGDAVGGLDLEYTLLASRGWRYRRFPAKVVDGGDRRASIWSRPFYGVVLAAIGSRMDTHADVETSNGAGVLRRLPLHVVEVGWNGDNRVTGIWDMGATSVSKIFKG